MSESLGGGAAPARRPARWRVGRAPLAAALLILALTLPAAWPFLTHAGYWQSHDGLFHLYRLLSLAAAWQQGHPYPRLFPDFAFGYGFAVLNFYGPLCYYVALALHGLGLSAIAATKATFALSYSFAALAAWWFARDLWRQEGGAPNEWAGVVAALAYTYTPYHMADVQLRGALAESWAFVWWPLLFWAGWRGRLWPLTLSVAALVLTHNLSVVLVAGPLALWLLVTVVWGPGPGQKGQAAPLVHRAFRAPPAPIRTFLLASLLALLLTAFYWLPVLLESRHVWIAQDVGGLGFERHLMPLGSWVTAGPAYRYFPDQGVAAEHPLSWAQVALLGVALLALPRLWRGAGRGPLLFWWLTLGAVLFLLTPLSFPLWRYLVFPFGLVQYPWRWLGIACLATAMVAASLVAPRSAGGGQRGWVLVCAPLLLWLALSSMQHLPWMAQPVEGARHPAEMWAGDAAAGQVGATWTAEFLPLTVREQRWALARAPQSVEGVGDETPLRVQRVGGDGFTLWAEVTSEGAGVLTFPRFAYPSMRGTVDGQARPVEPRGLLGLASIAVPAGSHRVALAGYPLADRPGLAWGLALLPVVLLGSYGVARSGKRWLLVVPVAVALFLLAPRQGEGYSLAGVPIRFGEQADLVGVRYPVGTVRAGETVALRLLWFNRRQTAEGYNTFIHLTAAGGGLPLVQHDSVPNMGTVPTSRWLAGHLVEDLHLLPLPAALAPGEYELWGGMYAVREGAAVPIPGDSGERRLLGRLKVGN